MLNEQDHNAIGQGLANIAKAYPDYDTTTTRNWQGFFQNLASFIGTLLPIILPLFSKTKAEADKH